MKSTLEKVLTILNSDMNQKSHIMSKPISEIRDKMHQIKNEINQNRFNLRSSFSLGFLTKVYLSTFL